MWEYLIIGAIIGLIFGIINRINAVIDRREALREEPVKIKDKDVRMDEMIDFIHSVLLRKGMDFDGSYIIPENIISEVTKSGFEQKAVQKLARDMLRFIKTPENVVVHIHNEYENFYWNVKGSSFVTYDSTRQDERAKIDGNKPGYYYSCGTGNREIHLFKKHNYTVQHILAILAHEISHHFLNTHSISMEPEEKNEVLTDVTAIYLGFGQLLLEGYKPVKWITDELFDSSVNSYTVNSYRIGYITTNDIAYGIKLADQVKSLEKKKRRERQLYQDKIEINKRLVDELLDNLSITERLYIDNRIALDALQNKKQSIASDDLNTIMENSNSHHTGEIERCINHIKERINQQTFLDGKMHKQFLVEINNLSTKIAYWNSTIGKYL